jgi:hypothetical protein
MMECYSILKKKKILLFVITTDKIGGYYGNTRYRTSVIGCWDSGRVGLGGRWSKDKKIQT